QALPAGWASVVEALRAASVQAGGSTVVEECPPQLRANIDVWGTAPDAAPIMRRLKELFDPLGVLNPGRYVGGI
ncbi:MAG TPA: FAD-linked oxidase C-terminal domain-containing protein, partial [Dehalococcoidia bacterium]|nr:FAD-linked oxidase C-terminal domain-containing protein [Dehalococcoidia bacterium]